jgi:hypothetical protein
MGIFSRGIVLSYMNGKSGEWTDLTNLQEIPDLGGTAEAIEITTLDDAAHMYMDGLLNYGDSLDFKFLYESVQFYELANKKGTYEWKVKLADDTACAFEASPSVKLDGVGVNAALTYTLSLKPSSEMIWTSINDGE